MSNEMQVPEGYMMDKDRRLVPLDSIRAIDLARDALVKEKAAKMMELHEQIKALKQELDEDIQAFVELSAERYDVRYGGEKGNLSLVSFDGKYQILRQVSELIAFDEGLQIAKQLIDECLRDWSTTSGKELKTLVDHIFRVDKKKGINTQAILGLRRYDFDDERWKKAMHIISESVQVVNSKSYIRLQVRDNEGDYKTIPLDIAAV